VIEQRYTELITRIDKGLLFGGKKTFGLKYFGVILYFTYFVWQCEFVGEIIG